MQENEFEKQVRNMMEEFHLSPSNAVWDKVSRRLNNKRRRKIPFVFLLTATLLTAGYFVYYIAKNQTQNSNISTVSKSSHLLKTDSISLEDSNNLPAQKSSSIKDKAELSSNNKTEKAQNRNIYIKTSKPVEKLFVTNEYKKEEPVNLNNTSNPQLTNLPNNNVQQLNIKPDKENDTILLQQNVQGNATTVFNKPANDDGNASRNIGKNSVPVYNDFAKADSTATVENKKNKAITKSTKNSPGSIYKIPAWQFGVIAAYGRSTAIEGLVDLHKSAYAYNDPGSVNNNGDTVFHNAHPYTASDAYQFGVVLQKKILKNGFISSGLNFVHLSTKSGIHQKVDSTYLVQNNNGVTNAYSVKAYYQPGSSSTYTNTYNFIELPVYFQQDFFGAKQVGFSYNLGFSLRQLISSNALIYNQYNNIYFSKDELLRKTQFQFMTGLSLKINAGKSTSIYFGPQVSYSLSNLVKNDNNSSFYLVNYGLQAGLMFHKK
jgi:hypothetical protein